MHDDVLVHRSIDGPEDTVPAAYDVHCSGDVVPVADDLGIERQIYGLLSV